MRDCGKDDAVRHQACNHPGADCPCGNGAFGTPVGYTWSCLRPVHA